MTSPQERTHIRSQLRVRWNINLGCHEVYTTIHGTGIFRWYRISDTTRNWYLATFNLDYEQPFLGTGEIDPQYFQRNPDIIR